MQKHTKAPCLSALANRIILPFFAQSIKKQRFFYKTAKKEIQSYEMHI